MAKNYLNKTWKRKTLTALSLTLAATLSLGALSACTKPDEDDDETNSKVAPTDIQIIKNGDFEFYSDKLVDPDEETGKPLAKKNIITSSPDNWTFTSGSPSSDTKSGVIDTADWDYFTKTGGYAFGDVTVGEGDDEKTEKTFSSIAEAYEHWEDENVSAYDRLKFLDLFSDEIEELKSNSDEAKLFAKYSYAVDFEDVEKLAEEVGGSPLRDGATEGEGKEKNTSVLMIHNQKTSDGVRGTAQYYTSSTTVTLTAGTAAEISVWVRTDALYHYEDTQLEARGGAYIGVTNTVGGSTLDQMQIYNIHTDGEWQQYTVYVRASTFATTTFRIVLGLGQGSSDDKYYMVDGYAFFDDVTCTLMPGEGYEDAVYGAEHTVKEGVKECTVDSLKHEKQFDTDKFPYEQYKTFALDLYAPNDAENRLGELLGGNGSNVSFDLTKEVSGSKTYDSSDKGMGEDGNDITKVTSYNELQEELSSNSYLQKVFERDFNGEKPFPAAFDKDEDLIMILSAGGAAYTATLGDITLNEDEHLLISFFVKTSEIPGGLTGAGAILVDGENKTTISPFDSTTLADIDIDSSKDADESLKDIYKGWTQCFFFLENNTEETKTFHIELTYGPTSIATTDKTGFGDGYAAFTHFETKELTTAEYGYATTGDRAKKVSLTGGVEESKKFDSVSANAEKDLESKPATPANYFGVLGGSEAIVEGGGANIKPNVTSGLLNAKYAANYFGSTESWKTTLGGTSATADAWWNEVFGNARQPLVIVNHETAAWGYAARSTATVSASSYSRISLRVKASPEAIANIYLVDTAAEEAGTLVAPTLPAYTYWYDDNGNIVNMDPQADDFDDNGKILYELQANGLYLKADSTDQSYYANLSNFEKDGDGNLTTKAGTIVFYENGGKYYLDREENTKTGEYSFTTEVKNLPAENLRYNYSDKDALAPADANVTIEGTGEWVTVNFYVHTGDTQKTYRLEVWSGSRDGQTENGAGSYVIFDNCATADVTSDYPTLRDDAVNAIKEKLNEGKKPGDEGYLGKDDPLPEEYARYYAFTLFDANTYERYNADKDTENRGNYYYTYKQSDYEEDLVWLFYEDEADSDLSFFLDFGTTDVTVERTYPPAEEETETDHTHTDEDGEPMNIWLLISSGSLAIILVAVIIILIVRRLMKNFGKRTKVKAKKDNRYRPQKNASDGEETDETEE